MMDHCLSNAVKICVQTLENGLGLISFVVDGDPIFP